MKKKFFSTYFSILFFTISLSFNSCISTKTLTYFNNIPKDSVSQVHYTEFETKISRNDVLEIDISTPDDITTKTLNSVSSKGYLVDETGIIKLPLLGGLKAEGLTKRQLATLITDELLNRKLAIDPIVEVRITNYKITVLGEVNHPGIIAVPNEKITLPEALGSAGDLTIYGKRNNVLLIREIGNKRVYKRFSLNNDQLFDQDIYNLQNQDIIYVEPNKVRATTNNLTLQLLPTVLSLLSFGIYLFFIFKK